MCKIAAKKHAKSVNRGRCVCGQRGGVKTCRQGAEPSKPTACMSRAAVCEGVLWCGRRNAWREGEVGVGGWGKEDAQAWQDSQQQYSQAGSLLPKQLWHGRMVCCTGSLSWNVQWHVCLAKTTPCWVMSGRNPLGNGVGKKR